MTSQKWLEKVYGVLVGSAHLPKEQKDSLESLLAFSVVEAIASGEIKGWTTAQKVCGLIAKARKQ